MLAYQSKVFGPFNAFSPSLIGRAVTLSTGTPAASAAAACTRVITCVPVHISQAPGVSETLQFCGSIVAWARNGSSYSASHLSP
jgi:hypothetical protein